MLLENCGTYTSDLRLFPVGITDWTTELDYLGTVRVNGQIDSEYFTRSSQKDYKAEAHCDVLLEVGTEVYRLKPFSKDTFVVASTVVTECGLDQDKWIHEGIMSLEDAKQFLIGVGGSLELGVGPKRSIRI